MEQKVPKLVSLRGMSHTPTGQCGVVYRGLVVLVIFPLSEGSDKCFLPGVKLKLLSLGLGPVGGWLGFIP